MKHVVIKLRQLLTEANAPSRRPKVYVMPTPWAGVVRYLVNMGRKKYRLDVKQGKLQGVFDYTLPWPPTHLADKLPGDLKGPYKVYKANLVSWDDIPSVVKNWINTH